MQAARHDKHRSRFHLGCQTSQTFPCFPFVQEFIADRLHLRLMLSVKSILALYHTYMERKTFFLCRLHERVGHMQIRYCRKFDRRIFFAGAFHAYRPGCNHDIPAFHVGLHTAAGSDPDKGICSAAVQFLHGNGCRRPADSSRSHTHFHAVQCTGIGHKFPVIGDQNRILKILCDLHAPFRISRHDHISADFSLRHLYMILSARIF